MEIGFIFQGFNLIPNLTAKENVELPLIYRGVSKKEREDLAVESLKAVGLEHRMDQQAKRDVRRTAAASSYCQSHCGQTAGDTGR